MGPRRSRIPTGALVRNDRQSGIARWGVWEPVRSCMEFRLGCCILTSHLLSASFSGGVMGCIGWRFACVDHLLRYPPFPGKLKRRFG